MASARKKQDEKNLKILRELVAQPGNKHCFDCNQRGPTYVNMTIGSFVCTKCSGMLRGLNPPHRVKSISMASFTTDEVELVKSRGNEYCRSTWLALWDQNPTTETKDEQEIKDFMIDKYERQRFFHDKGLRNGTLSPANSQKSPEIKPLTNLVGSQTITIKSSFNRVNGDSGKLNNGTGNNGTTDFVADFNSADIFSASNQFNNNNHQATNGSTSQPSFANFDNNVIFNSATYQSSYDLLVSQLTQMPKYVTHRWHVTSPPTLNSPNNLSQSPMNKSAMPPSEDRYAALKDLDNALKNQQQHQQQHQQQQQQQHQQQQQQQYQPETHLEWNSGSNCNGSGYASPSQSSSSLYGSPSTAGSIYGSPSQGQFATSFDPPNNVSNPFSSNTARSPWTPNGNSTVIANNFQTQFGANPFRADNGFNGVSKFSNGATNGFNGNSFNGNSFHGNGFNGNQQSFQQQQQQQQQNMFTSSQNFGNSKPWTSPNPFALGVSPGNSATNSNPFL